VLPDFQLSQVGFFTASSPFDGLGDKAMPPDAEPLSVALVGQMMNAAAQNRFLRRGECRGRLCRANCTVRPLMARLAHLEAEFSFFE
jgi:hypothetical protein